MRFSIGRLMVIVAFLGFLAWFIRPGWVFVRGSTHPWVFIVAITVLLFAKLVGLAWVVQRLLLGGRLLAGEWIWLGSVAAFVFGGCITSVTMHRSQRGIFSDLATLLVIQLLVGICLAAFGRRPSLGDPAWAHYAGWIMLGADALFYGLVARDALLH